MMRPRDGPPAWSEAQADGRQAGAARERLNEAVAELRRLTDDQLFQALERLADINGIRISADVSVESVRMLRVWSAEHLRLAAELEAAARCCRLIEQELNQQLDALLPGPPGHAEPAVGRRATKPPRSHRVMRVAAWLKDRSGREQRDRELVNVSPGMPEELPPGEPERSPPLSDRPGADVSALLLGPLELIVAGRRVVRWNSLKARAVFQYLLIHHDRPVRRDVLMDLQWPNHTYTSARNNLNVALYNLRNTLEGPWQGLQPIVYKEGCYVLNPDLEWWIDRDEFLSALSEAQVARASDSLRKVIHHYHRAVQLYRGPLFEDDLTGDWYLPEQRHLNELYLQALESLGEIYFDLGELSSAEQFAQLALANDPCCEPVHRLLMRCYASEQKQQLVSRQYSICVDALRDELGVSPGAETLRLFHDLTSAPL
jgi:DNA-binding SARP family transcriptional activator